MADGNNALYHERQTLYRCGLHALNNVLQGPVFTKESLDETCDELASRNASSGLVNWVWNAHRSPLGIGNYDVNALTLALQQRGYAMQWVDKRRPVNEQVVNLDKAEGVLCNVVMATAWSSLWTQRHWFALCKIRGMCYNLDSKLTAPAPFDSERQCYQFLQELVNTGECELFLVEGKRSDSAIASLGRERRDVVATAKQTHHEQKVNLVPSARNTSTPLLVPCQPQLVLSFARTPPKPCGMPPSRVIIACNDALVGALVR